MKGDLELVYVTQWHFVDAEEESLELYDGSRAGQIIVQRLLVRRYFLVYTLLETVMHWNAYEWGRIMWNNI